MIMEMSSKHVFIMLINLAYYSLGLSGGPYLAVIIGAKLWLFGSRPTLTGLRIQIIMGRTLSRE